jgi:hypothetical protein
MKTLCLVVSACLVLSTVALAKERNGIRMPDTVTAEGKTLKLQGMGLRTKFVFKVYAAGLYLETPSTDPATILAADEVRRVHLFLLRKVGKQQIGEAISEGFTRNSKDKLPSLQERLNKLMALLPDLKETDEVIFTYVPGKGVLVSGKTDGIIEGKDFADALFAVWLGAQPADGSLKKQLLGGE